LLRRGDKLLAKTHFMLQNPEHKNREFEVLEYDGSFFHLKNKEEEEIEGVGHDFLIKNFYLPDCINQEILTLLESGDIQFESFQGVTKDGKVIQMELPK